MGRNMTEQVNQPWDTLMKLVIGEKAQQALVSLALPGVVVVGALDKELRITNLEGDLFLRAYLGGRRTVVHLEFQKKMELEKKEEIRGVEDWEEWERKRGKRGRDGKKRKKEKPIDRRMWEYNCAMDIQMECPVYSILVYLTPEGPAVEPPYVWGIAGTGHYFMFRVIKMWEVEKEQLKRPEYADLLPLLPLTKGGNTPQAVEEMADELMRRNQSDLLPLGLFCAGLVLKDKVDQLWLTERFGSMGSILEDLWVYQRVIAKGEAKGIVEGSRQQLRQMLVRRVQKRFPTLVPLAEEKAALLQDVEILNTVIDAINDAETLEEARDILEGCLPN